MKTSKKIIIPFFSTVVGLSMAAGVGGAFAWYQYNSQASASFVGASVADTGVLQIGHYVIEQVGGVDTPVMKWGRDFYGEADLATLTPVTFGQLEDDLSLPQAGAFAYPEAGCGAGYSGWEHAVPNRDYAQFDIYFRALVPDSTSNDGFALAARNVFISDSVIKSVTANKVADEALRVHLAVDGGDNYLFAKNTREGNDALELSGQLDLDHNDHLDTYHETAFAELPANVNDGDPMIYGVEGDTQETVALSSYEVARTNGVMPKQGETDFDKAILTTSASEAVKVTVTIWLEGWEYLTVDDQDTQSQIWNPEYSADTDVQVGIQFDTGVFRGSDITDY